jgi:tRNA1(Val) A37 N6-methylase TrmN6
MRAYDLEPKRLQFVYPRPGQEANIVLVEGEKGAKPGIRTLPPMTLWGDDND